MEGPDHAASLEYHEFKSLVDGCKEIKLALGDSKEKRISQGEMINRENLSKSLVASRNLKKVQNSAPKIYENDNRTKNDSPRASF